MRRSDAEDADANGILDTIERWVARELKPIVREYDHADRYPTEVVEQMKELGPLFPARSVSARNTAGSASPPSPTPRS